MVVGGAGIITVDNTTQTTMLETSSKLRKHRTIIISSMNGNGVSGLSILGS
jgi:hypothetical protein